MQILSNQHLFNNINTLKKTDVPKLENNVAKKKDIQLSSVYYPIFTGLQMKTIPTKLERFEGCLFGGAIGDAFGRLAEFRTLASIKQKFGELGVKYIPKIDGKYLISDDTQMTLFTANGLLKSYLKIGNLEIEPNYNDIYSSYLDWYKTQTLDFHEIESKNGLISNKNLFSRRGPGITCLTALKEGKPGSLNKKINMSAGNGGIMRISPIALMYNENPELSFKIAAECTALTHGNPNAYLPAGYLSAMISNILHGKSLLQAIEETNLILKKYENFESTLANVYKAISLAKEEISDYEAISKIGLGKLGNEALGIAIFSVLRSPLNFKQSLEIATNHDGDSDTTAAITGNIFGAINGVSSIPKKWLRDVECAELLYYFSNRLLISSSDNSIKNSISKKLNMHERWDTDVL